MHRALFLVLASAFSPFAAPQMMGNLPHPVVMVASFAKEIAVCEAAQGAFAGETVKYLREIDRMVPGHLDSSSLETVAQDLVKTATSRDLTFATEVACREKVFPIAEKAL